MLPLRRLTMRSAEALLLAIIVIAAAPIASRAETTPVPAEKTKTITSAAAEPTLRAHWKALFKSRSWAKLDALAERLRSQRLRFQGGGWQLHVLYYVVLVADSPYQTDADWERRIAALKDWSRAFPASPTPRIALADAYSAYAWVARGTGDADSVTPEGWKLLNERDEEARRILEGCEAICRSDPEWYNATLGVDYAEGSSRSVVESLADEALQKYPGYFYVVEDVAEYLLPKWYGAPGDTEQYAEAVADRLGGDKGDATYFFTAYIGLVEEYHCESCMPPAMSWPRILRGYAAVQRLYGTNNYEVNALAYLAMRAGDTETAQRAFKEIGENWNRDVWQSKADFDSERSALNQKQVEPAPSQ